MAGPKNAPGDGRGAQPPDEGRGTDGWWKAPDGTVFASADDLAKVWPSLVPKSEYTKKTQELAREREALLSDRKKLDLEREERLQQYKSLEEKQAKFEKYDRLVKERPDVYKQLESALRQGPGADVMMERVQQMFEEKYGSKIQEIESWKAEQESTRTREAAYKALREKHKDFNPEQVEKAIEELTTKLQGGDVGYLAERLYLANRGNVEPPEQKETLISGSGQAPPASDYVAKSLDEAAELTRSQMI